MTDLDNSLIIADFCYRQIILAVKDKHPEWNFKVISKEELTGMLNFDYAEEINGVSPIAVLLKEEAEKEEGRMDYSTLSKMMRVLRLVGNGKVGTLDEIYDTLDKAHYIKKDALGMRELSLYKKVLVFEADEDVELNTLLRNHNIKYEVLHFTDLDYQDRRREENAFYKYPDKVEQFISVFSIVRKDIIEENIDPRDIVIGIHDGSDDYYVDSISKLFDLPCDTIVSRPLVSDTTVSGTLKNIQTSESLTFDNNECEPLYDLIKKYHLDEIEDFSFAYLNLLEIIKEESVAGNRKYKGMTARSDLNFLPNAHYYVTNFIHGDYYAVYTDNDCFTDEELEKLGVNTSYVKTNLDRRKKENFLKYMDVRLLSRVEKHLDDKFYDSQFTENKTNAGKKYVLVKRTLANKGKLEEFVKDGSYTKNAVNFVSSIIKDINGCPADKDLNYRIYDHKYTPVTAALPKTYSTSQLKQYYECPFYYYLENILTLDKYDDDQNRYNAHLGTLIHKVFEKVHSPDFDFEKAYEEGLNEIRKSRNEEGKEESNAGQNESDDVKEKEKRETEREALQKAQNDLEDANIKIAKDHIKLFAETIRTQNTKVVHVDNKPDVSVCICDEKAEQKVDFTIPSNVPGREPYKLTGFIDKLLYTEYDGQRYYTVIDYKTGKESIKFKEIFSGGSLQVPLYCHALTQDENKHLIEYTNEEGNTAEYEYGSFGIEHIFTSKPPFRKHIADEKSRVLFEYTSVCKLKGLAPKNQNYRSSFGDPIYKTTDYISYHFSYDNPNSSISYLKTYTLNELMEDAVNAASNSLDSIFDKHFEIAPTKASSADPYCALCRYRNICYRSTEDIRDLRKDIGAKFYGNYDEGEGEY